MTDHLFVYGTLRSDARHPMHAVLARDAEPLGRGTVAGALYDMGPYPAVVVEDAAAEADAPAGAGSERDAPRTEGGERVTPQAEVVPGPARDGAPASGAGRVAGEVYRLRDAVRTLALLDEYEGCGPRDAHPHAFERVVVEATLDGGRVLRAWLYVYRGGLSGARRIDSGDYLRR